MSDSPTARRLCKREVEALMDTYDADPVASLTTALSRLLDPGDESWEAIVASLPLSDTTKAGLIARETRALDDLVKRLVEHRSLEE